ESYLAAHSHGPAAPEDQQYQDFLADFLSEDLTFRTAGGTLLVGKEAYLHRPPAATTRYASASVNLVHKTPESVLLSAQVHTRPKGEGSPTQSYSNTRLFVKKDDHWKCRIWINYPESAIV